MKNESVKLKPELNTLEGCHRLALSEEQKKNKRKRGKRMLKTTELRIAAVLAIIGGVTSTVSGGLIWVPYVVARRSWGVLSPLLGFVGF